MALQVWTISNGLSFLRLVLVIPIAALLLDTGSDHRPLLVALVLVAVLSDLFDGMLARKRGEVTQTGMIIDPLADKIIVGTVALILASQHRLPLWLVSAILLRDLAILGCGIYLRKSRNLILPSIWTGKWAVSALGLLLFVVMLDIPSLDWLQSLLIATGAVMLVVSTVQYGKRYAQVLAGTY